MGFQLPPPARRLWAPQLKLKRPQADAIKAHTHILLQQARLQVWQLWRMPPLHMPPPPRKASRRRRVRQLLHTSMCSGTHPLQTHPQAQLQ